MALKHSSGNELKAVLFPAGPWPVRESLRQACQLFFFSFVFAVVFNLFFSYGIELRVKPSTGQGFQPKKVASISPLGWVTPAGTKKTNLKTTASTAAAAQPEDIVRVSLSGVKTRF